MMVLKDYHTHTNFCDGKDSPEDMVKAAMEKGMAEIGILTHAYMDFDQSYCIKKERIGEFQAEIARLKAIYGDKISILCGVEQDVLSFEPTTGFDYVIASAHYVKKGNEYCVIDESREKLCSAVNAHFGGDYYAFAEQYYKTIAQAAKNTNPTIIGHFDLISKFNESECLFSESDSRYIKSWQYALDALLPYGIPFEINTGAIARGCRTKPYPNNAMIDYIVAHGGKLLLSSDSHCKENLCFEFEKWSGLLPNKTRQ